MLEARRVTRSCPSKSKYSSNLIPSSNQHRIFLNATNEKALDKVSLEDLKKFAVDKE